MEELLARAAWHLLEELQSCRLEVVKVKGLRRTVSENADWYRRFCEANKRRIRRYPRERTVIKRWWTIHVLKNMAAGHGRTDTVYGQRLLPFLEERIR